MKCCSVWWSYLVIVEIFGRVPRRGSELRRVDGSSSLALFFTMNALRRAVLRAPRQVPRLPARAFGTSTSRLQEVGLTYSVV